MIINNVNMPNFTHDEIPPDVAKYMDQDILRCIQAFRSILGCPVEVSRAKGATVRFDGPKSSGHRVLFNTDTGELLKPSTAIDCFPQCNIFDAWSLALSSNLFGGVGVYFDTRGNRGELQPMLHLDTRSRPVLWYRKNDKYSYPHTNCNFFRVLLKEFTKL